MVSLYGPDTLSMLRAASESLNQGSQSQSQCPRPKKWIRSSYMELVKKSDPMKDQSLPLEILTWFKKLTPEARAVSLCHQAPLICTFLWQMFIKKLSEGEHDFALNTQQGKNFDPDKVERNFKVKKRGSESQFLTSPEYQRDKYFEQSLRLSDTEEYLDTLYLDYELVNDIEKFLDCMKILSGNRCFSSPCCVFWDGSLTSWLWEYPSWFDSNEYHSLAAWACASFERALWVAFWESSGKDPRVKSTRNYVFKEPSTLLSSQLALTRLLETLKKPEKAKIVGKLEEITQDYFAVKTRVASHSTRIINCSTLPMFMPSSLYPLSSSFLPCCINPVSSFYSYASKTRIKYYQTIKSAELVLQQMAVMTDKQFVEFLMFSPIDRTVTLLDLVVRKALYRVMNAYTEKNAMELILGEPAACKKSGKKGKQKKKTKMANRKKNGNTEKKEENPQEIKEFFEGFLKDLVEKVLKLKESTVVPVKEVVETNTGFEEVRKKPRKSQPQQKSKQLHKKPTKHYKSQSKVLISPSKPDFNSETPLLKPCESTQPSEPSLHRQIINFGESMTWKLEKKIASINKVLEKLNEIVLITFAGVSIVLFGSYASGLAIEASDVDIVVIGLDVTNRAELEISCEYLANQLKIHDFITKIQPISTARIPVIKLEVNTLTLTGKDTQVLFDITFDDSSFLDYGTHFGLSTLYLTKELQKLYPSLQYLVLVLKQFLYEHDLNSSYKGGLSSYSLVLWVAALLNSMANVSENLGELLIEFFRFFGTEFDPCTIGVNILNGGSFFQLDYPGFEAVVTIDPVNQLNNTRMSYNIKEVLAAFKKAYGTLQENNKANKLRSIFHK